MERRPTALLGVPLDELATDLGDRSTDPDPARLEVDFLDAETDEFAEPHPGVGEQQDRVALIRRRGWLARSQIHDHGYTLSHRQPPVSCPQRVCAATQSPLSEVNGRARASFVLRRVRPTTIE
jgi:hypothetical protein